MSPSNLKVRTFVKPPKRFDPLTAKSKELLLHGFPQPPSADSPRALELWKKAMATYRDSQAEYVVPEFGPLADGHSVKVMRPFRSPAEPAAVMFGVVPDMLGDYSGIALLPKDATLDPMQSISARFTVPNIYPFDNPNQFNDGNFWTFAWLGIDGLTNQAFPPTVTLDSDLLAVGSATVTRHNVPDCYLWYAWYWNGMKTSQAGRLTNMPVSPGDALAISVCSDDKGVSPLIIISNLSARQYSSFTFDTLNTGGFLQRPQLYGSSVEAIVSTEVVDLGPDDQGRTQWNTHLPRYGEVWFQEPLVFKKSGQVLDYSSAVGLAMVDRLQNIISAATVTPEAFLVYYTGP